MEPVERKSPPHDPQAEQVVLGAVLKDSGALEIVRDIISVTDLYIENHQVIFEAMLKLADQGIPIDLVTMMDHLKSAGLLEEAGRMSYLWKLLDCTPTAGNARHYAGMIRDKTKQRNINNTVDWLQEVATDDQSSEEELEAVLSVLLRNVRQGADPSPTLIHPGDFIDETADRFDGKVDGLATGFPIFDYKLFGIIGITVLGAAPKIGKSVFALNVALNVAKKGGIVLYYDMENGRPLVMRRLLSNFYSKTITQLKNEQTWKEAGRADLAKAIPGFRICTDHASMKPDLIHREAQRAQDDNILIVLDSLHAGVVGAYSEAWDGSEEELEAVLSVLLRNVRQGADPSPTLIHPGDFIDETADRFDGKVDGLATGFPIFDYKLFGIIGITVLGAAPKIGKSVFALNVALNVAKKGGIVLYYDMENGRPLVMRRLLSNFYSKTITQLKNEQTWKEAGRADLAKAIPGFRICTDHASMKPDLIHREAQRAQDDNILIVLDSLQKLPPLEKQRRDSLDRWLRELEQIKQDPAITILLISELSRGEKEAHYRTPTLGSFKESGDIEYSGDMLLQFVKDKGDTGHMVLHCVANRHGQGGKIAKYSYENFKYWRWTEVPKGGDV